MLDRPTDEPGPLPPPRPAPRRPRGRLAATGVVLAAVVVAIAARGRPLTLPWDDAAEPPTTALITSTVAPTRPPVATTIAPATPDGRTGRAEIERLFAGDLGVCGVVLMSEHGDVLYSRNADTPFIAASLYKLILLADIYRRIDGGEFALSRRIDLLAEYFPAPDEPEDGYYAEDAIGTAVALDEALFATGAYSSNVAARALLDLTDTPSLQATADTIGLRHTHLFVDPSDLPDWPPPPGADAPPEDLATAVAFVETQARDGPVMLTTPRDMAIYFQRLLAGRIVSGEASFAIYGILARQVVDDRFPVLLPRGTGMAHKTGNLDHVVHDVGVIFAPDGPVILAAMIEAPQDDARATELIQRLALIAYEGDLQSAEFLEAPGA